MIFGVIFWAPLLALTLGSPEDPDITYAALYQWGKDAYTAGRWYECVAFMKRALEDHEYYNNVILHCQKKCRRLVHVEPHMPLSDQQIAEQRIAEIRLFEKITQKSLCLQRCTNDRLGGDRPKPADPKAIQKVDDEFDRLMPYSYMQFCYWKLNDLDHAVSAAYTFYVRNPTDTMMSDNLRFYSTQPQFSTKMFKNLKEYEHEDLYAKSVDYYEAEDYENAAINFELTLKSYLKSYENCRLICIKNVSGTDQRISEALDVYSAINNHLHGLLSCRSQCLHKMSMIKNVYVKEFVPQIFHYLQFAYWKSNKIRKACEAVATYLMFSPIDETMLGNKQFYSQQAKVTQDFFIPRKDLVEYFEKESLDTKLLKYIDEKFKYENNEFVTPEHPDDYRDFKSDVDHEAFNVLLDKFDKLEDGGKAKESAADSKNMLTSAEGEDRDENDDLLEPPPKKRGVKGDIGDFASSNGDHKKNSNQKAQYYPASPTSSVPKTTTALTEAENVYYSPSSEVLDHFKRFHGINVAKKEQELNGSQRFFAENLLTRSECNNIMKLKDLSQLGSGYAGKSSPHTKHENFYGLTVGKLAELAADSKIPLDIAKLFVEKTELARNFVEQYFNLSTHLYIDYTHFVCRSTKPGSNKTRTDLSHPIHGDNCMFRDGRCDKLFPAFTWRDFSAIVYLNDDFDGGEFIFADAKENEAAVLKPHCGEMVAFSGNTLHGVKAVTSGVRCVMALWMTLDPDHQEKERIQAEKLLAELERKRIGSVRA